MTQICNWPLGNGESLEFEVFAENTAWNKVPGLYIFAHLQGNMWTALYVGKTINFSSRLPDHDRLDEAIKLGATHIHAVVIPQQRQRDILEQMLIQYLQPPLNDHYR
ncbi:GIY-YIG nuclease family protein [Trichormus variabilis]|uniref:GIY-YIG domain-containing protein n=1 Tax=Trichormus variabilis SAG 1403-4b TaxID=447716 RepID=A0A3S5K352_ANAVA|nr:GIY-YIG nuclease family protein [Trichormus variabilis]MBD2626450.1 GIY-YIG nuclease family protein [Trichormus variabilis FACHB-164]RUS96010.1 hypothetical protein DSM107003_26720 [Trichormus variabilis SAG 1403-4b]